MLTNNEDESQDAVITIKDKIWKFNKNNMESNEVIPIETRKSNSRSKNKEDLEYVTKKVEELDNLLLYVKQIVYFIEEKKSDLNEKKLLLSQSAQLTTSPSMPILSPQQNIKILNSKKSTENIANGHSSSYVEISFSGSDQSMPNLSPFNSPDSLHMLNQSIQINIPTKHMNPHVILKHLHPSIIKQYNIVGVPVHKKSKIKILSHTPKKKILVKENKPKRNSSNDSLKSKKSPKTSLPIKKNNKSYSNGKPLRITSSLWMKHSSSE